MSTMAPHLANKPRMGRVPWMPQVRCANCNKVLAERGEEWRGDPEWIKCHRCRTMNRVSEDGVWAVAQAGDMQPLPPR